MKGNGTFCDPFSIIEKNRAMQELMTENLMKLFHSTFPESTHDCIHSTMRVNFNTPKICSLETRDLIQTYSGTFSRYGKRKITEKNYHKIALPVTVHPPEFIFNQRYRASSANAKYLSRYPHRWITIILIYEYGDDNRISLYNL